MHCVTPVTRGRGLGQFMAFYVTTSSGLYFVSCCDIVVLCYLLSGCVRCAAVLRCVLNVVMRLLVLLPVWVVEAWQER